MPRVCWSVEDFRNTSIGECGMMRCVRQINEGGVVLPLLEPSTCRDSCCCKDAFACKFQRVLRKQKKKRRKKRAPEGKSRNTISLQCYRQCSFNFLSNHHVTLSCFRFPHDGVCTGSSVLWQQFRNPAQECRQWISTVSLCKKDIVTQRLSDVKFTLHHPRNVGFFALNHFPRVVSLWSGRCSWSSSLQAPLGRDRYVQM